MIGGCLEEEDLGAPGKGIWWDDNFPPGPRPSYTSVPACFLSSPAGLGANVAYPSRLYRWDKKSHKTAIRRQQSGDPNIGLYFISYCSLCVSSIKSRTTPLLILAHRMQRREQQKKIWGQSSQGLSCRFGLSQGAHSNEAASLRRDLKLATPIACAQQPEGYLFPVVGSSACSIFSRPPPNEVLFPWFPG